MPEQNYNNLSEPGVYRAMLRSWGLKENTETGTVVFAVLFVVTAQLNNGEWQEWAGQSAPTVFGNFVVVKKDGSLLETQIKNIRAALGWDGNFSSLQNGDWSNSEVRITCAENEYQGKVTVRAEWMNPLDGGGGATLGNLDDQRLKALDARFGGQLRALGSGSAGSGGSKNQGRAHEPVTAGPRASDGLNYDRNMVRDVVAEVTDDIPF